MAIIAFCGAIESIEDITKMENPEKINSSHLDQDFAGGLFPPVLPPTRLFTAPQKTCHMSHETWMLARRSFFPF